MASVFEYGKREVGREGTKMAGQALGSFLGDLALSELVSGVAQKAGTAVSAGAETAASKLGASAATAARVGKFAPLGTAIFAAVAPMVLEQLGKGGSSSAAEEIAVRQAGAMAAIDQKLQADLVRQEGYMRMNEQKFQQQLILQQARADAMTPRNQPMSGAQLFDALPSRKSIFSGPNQY